MVGVPHSKGCSLCLARHVKCDESRPQCTRCSRYGYLCPGYDRGLKFKNKGPRLKSRHGQSAQYPESAGRDITPGGAINNDCSRRTQPSMPITLELLRLMYHHAVLSIDQRISPSLVQSSWVGIQPQLFQDFVRTALPTLYSSNRTRSNNALVFTEYVMGHFGSHQFQDATLCCLGTMFLGYLKKDPSFLHASRQLYSDALRKVKRALNTDVRFSEDMLSTLMVLTVYELLAQTSPGAWIHHARAAKFLFLSRGVDAHMSGFGRSCFYAFRGFLIAHAFAEGQQCFLDQDEWQEFAFRVRKTVPLVAGDNPAVMDTVDRIFVQLAKCPGYISDTRKVTLMTPEKEVMSLCERISATCAELEALAADIQSFVAVLSQGQQDLSARKDDFVGPIPDLASGNTRSYILMGTGSTIAMLKKLLRVLQSRRLSGTIVTGLLASSAEISCSDEHESVTGNKASQGPKGSTLATQKASALILPSRSFSVVSDAILGPSHTIAAAPIHEIAWLDRIASSAGMIGADIIYEDDEIPATGNFEDIANQNIPIRPFSENSESIAGWQNTTSFET